MSVENGGNRPTKKKQTKKQKKKGLRNTPPFFSKKNLQCRNGKRDREGGGNFDTSYKLHKSLLNKKK